MPRKPLGDRPMTNAERQARYRAARATPRPVIHYRRAVDRRSLARRLARRCRRPAHLAGRVSRLAPGLARQPSGRGHRRGVADHRRPRPRRTPGDRTAKGLRPGLATPASDPTSEVAQLGKQAPPARAAPSLVRATARRALVPPVCYLENLIPSPARGVLFARRSGVPIACRLTVNQRTSVLVTFPKGRTAGNPSVL